MKQRDILADIWWKSKDIKGYKYICEKYGSGLLRNGWYWTIILSVLAVSGDVSLGRAAPGGSPTGPKGIGRHSYGVA